MPIGVAADKRDAPLPDVPTLAEQGYPEHRRVELVRAVGAGQDAARSDRQAQQSGQRCARRSGSARQAGQAGATPVGGTPESLGDFHEGRIRQMGPRRRSAGSRSSEPFSSGRARAAKATDPSLSRDSPGSRWAMSRMTIHPGRYSPVFGSGFNFGSVRRSSGSTRGLGAHLVELGIDAVHFLTHQRTTTAAPMTPKRENDERRHPILRAAPGTDCQRPYRAQIARASSAEIRSSARPASNGPAFASLRRRRRRRGGPESRARR